MPLHSISLKQGAFLRTKVWGKGVQFWKHLSQDTLLAAANSATTALGAAMMPRVLPVALAAVALAA